MTLAVKFVARSDSPRPSTERVSFGPDPQLQLEKARADQARTVFVMRVADLDSFRPYTHLVEDRGRKHKAKSLAVYLLGRERIPFIDGNYGVINQLLRGVRALLRRALDVSDQNAYIVGLREDIFDKLLARVPAVPPNPPVHLLLPGLADSEDDDLRETTLRWLRRVVVPKAFKLAYVGESEEVDALRRYAMLAASNNYPVLILGEMGTGKELLARQIHQCSRYASGRFVPVVCGALPGDSFASELFGHRKALLREPYSRDGLWKAAESGTLFFDEIGELDGSQQLQVLAAIRDSTDRASVSGKAAQSVARIIAASSRDLYAAVEAGRFNQDLYLLLCSFPINTPPLRDHPEDVPMLAQAFWRKIRGRSASLRQPLLDELQFYLWLGNARGLRTLLTTFSALIPDAEPDLDLLRSLLHRQPLPVVARPASARQQMTSAQLRESVRHMQRVHQVLQAYEKAAQPVLRRRPLGDLERVEVWKQTLRHYQELAQLCQRVPLFLDNTFTLVERTRAKLYQFQRLLSRANPTAPRYWEKVIATRLTQVLPAIFHAMRR